MRTKTSVRLKNWVKDRRKQMTTLCLQKVLRGYTKLEYESWRTYNLQEDKYDCQMQNNNRDIDF